MNEDFPVDADTAAELIAADLAHRLEQARSGDLKAKESLLESFRNYARNGQSVPPELAAFVVDVLDGNVPRYRKRPPLSESDQQVIFALMFRDPSESVDAVADRLDEDRERVRKLWRRYKERM